jgi:Transposase DDE domain
VHVKVTTVRGDKRTYRYLNLVESFREGGKVRHKVVARLGEADEMAKSGELARLIEALGAHVDGGGRAQELSVEAAPSIGDVTAVRAYFLRLGLAQVFGELGSGRRSVHLADTVFAMVANRLCAPSSKRRAILDWLGEDVVLPDDVASPSLDQCYRALDALCAGKDELEAHCYAALCDLTNLDLRLVCYDLTSSYVEGDVAPSLRFDSKAFGYSRDKRGNRPQVVIGLLVTGDGIPIAHHVFAGNTNDASTLPAVMDDLQRRFGVGRIALVADRGLICEANLDAVGSAGFDHVMATRLHRDPTVTAVLDHAAAQATRWVRIDEHTKAAEVTHEARRYVVVDSEKRHRRDDRRRSELLTKTEDQLIALAERVSGGRLVDPAKIGAAADRIVGDSGVGRCFTTTIGPKRFSWDDDQAALRYETDLLAGRYVLATSLDNTTAGTADVVRHDQALQGVERRFRVLKDFLALRPVFHFTEARVRGHIALCVLASVFEAVMANDLTTAGVMDPELEDQPMTPRRALRTLARIRAVRLVGDNGVERRVITKPNADQARILCALRVDTSTWHSRLSA